MVSHRFVQESRPSFLFFKCMVQRVCGVIFVKYKNLESKIIWITVFRSILHQAGTLLYVYSCETKRSTNIEMR